MFVIILKVLNFVTIMENMGPFIERIYLTVLQHPGQTNHPSIGIKKCTFNIGGR
jgi:hypothetical protein